MATACDEDNKKFNQPKTLNYGYTDQGYQQEPV